MGKIGQRIELTVKEVRLTVRGAIVTVAYEGGVTEPLYKVGSPEFQYHVEEGEEPPAPGDKIVFVGGARLDGCLTKAKPDEPIFVLLGRDPQAPGAIREWVTARLRVAGVQVPLAAAPSTLEDLALLQDEATAAKLAEALRQADAMTAWAGRRPPE